MSFETKNDGIVHSRELGEKVDGFHLYPSATWSSVAINDVEVDNTDHLEMKGKYLSHRKDIADEVEPSTIQVNSRKMDNHIRESSSEDHDFKKGSGLKKKYIRKRTIPRTNRKKYPTKPWDQSKQEKVKNTIEKINDEIIGFHGKWDDESGVVPKSIIPTETIINDWFNYGDELDKYFDGGEEKDQLILSRDLQLKDDLLKWEFHDMKTGDVMYMDYDATIKNVYAEWMKKKSRL